jgi:hypothetical protein
VVETITGLADNENSPNTSSVMGILEEIAKQLQAHLVNFPDHSLIELAEKKWKKMSGAEQAGESEPEAQTEDEPMRAGNAAGGPLVGFRSIDAETAIDSSGGRIDLGEPMDEITSQPNNTGKT